MFKYLSFLICILSTYLTSAQEKPFFINAKAINVLPANDAIISEGLKKTANDRDPKVFAVEQWRNAGQTFKWNVHVTEKDAYMASILTEIKGLSAGVDVTMQLSTAKGKTILKQTNTRWNKITFPAALPLDSGMNQLQLQLTGIPTTEHPDISVYSIELATEKVLQQTTAHATNLHSKPEWLNNAKYGLFFHWNSRSKPKTGKEKSYADAVFSFDVKKFAAMVHDIGADFIVLTTSWAEFTFPAPLKSVEAIVPGNTTPRDLIADLSDALAQWNIKLLVYCNFRMDKMGWEKGKPMTPANFDTIFDKMMSIYTEIGGRYPNKIAGVWIDDGMALYPYNAPFEQLTRALKRRNKNLVVGYNSWIYPRFTDFEDFYGGESGISLESAGIHNKDLPVGGDGYFVSGGQKGLKATFCGLLEPGDWTHTQNDNVIPPPMLKADTLIKIIQEAIRRKNVAIMNVSVYQDGSISPETFDLLKQLNRSIHK